METAKEMFDKLQDWVWSVVPESNTTRAVLVGLLAGLVVYSITKRRYRLPPGPRGLPIIGNLLSLRKISLFKKLVEWTETYGPVITLKIGPVRMVSLNSLETIQEALIHKSTDFAGRPIMYSGTVLTEGYKDIAFTDYGPTWQLHRRLALKALKYYMKGNRLESTIQDVLEVTVDELRTLRGPIDPDRYLKLTTFNILSKICFNEMFHSDNEEFLTFVKCLDSFQGEFSSGCLEDVFPPLRLCPTPLFRRFQRTVAYMLGFIYKRINQHRDTFSSDVQRDFTDAILLAQKEADAEENPELMAQFTDTHVGQTVADVFEGGYNTSQQTLYWVVLYAAAYPECQAKVHQEVDATLGSRTTPLMSDRQNLAYTEAFLYEVMRQATVGPLALPRSTTCDTTVGKYEIPKGTMVVPNLYAVHYDPRHWDRPKEFRPERFLDASGKIVTKQSAWLPFSVGKRSCMAEALAKPELLLIVAALLRNFEIQMPTGETANLEPMVSLPFAYAPHPYKVVLIDRRA